MTEKMFSKSWFLNLDKTLRDTGLDSDLYSFAIMAYECLSMIHPFAGKAAIEGRICFMCCIFHIS